MIQIQNLSHMLLVRALSFVKLLWPLLRFSSCTYDQDTCTPTNKLLTLTLRVTQKHVFSVHQIITPFTLSCVSLSKTSYAKKNSTGYASKGEKEKYPCQKAWEKKIACQRAWRKEKKKKKKEREKDSPYFQIKGIHSVWLPSPWGPVFDLAKYVMQVCLNFIPTQNSTQKAISGRIWKRRQNTKCLGEVSYTLSNRENHLRYLHLFCKTHKTSR